MGARKIELLPRQVRIAFVVLTLVLLQSTGSSGWSSGAARKPGQHLTIRPGAPVRLRIIATTRGPNDPHDFDLSLLVPRRTRMRQVWFIHGGRQPDQVLVEWVRTNTVSLYGQSFPENVPWGLTLWTQSPRRPADFQAPWHGIAIPHLTLAPGAPNLRVALADVTSDGHPDVLVEQYPHTNHGCGPHRVVATLLHGTTWRIFRAWLCETTLRGAGGLLALDLPYYARRDSVCCWSKVEKLRLRWAGNRYVTASDRIVRGTG
jgi:hypothetical protein